MPPGTVLPDDRSRIAAVPGVALAAPLRGAIATVNGKQGAVAGVDAEAFSQVVEITMESGNLTTGDDGLLVSQHPRRRRGMEGR